MPKTLTLLVVCLLCLTTLAQETPAPTTQKAATTATPKGYVRFEANGRAVICLPEDRGWVEAAATRVKVGVGPETRPADLHANLTAKRELIVATMLKDLPGLNPSQAEKLIDQTLLPQLKESAALKPRIVFLVSPAEHLKRAIVDGWTDPRVRYNRAADGIELDRTVSLTGPDSAESTVVGLFDPSDALETRTTRLAQYFVTTEEQVQQQIAARANTAALNALANFIADDGLRDLPKNEDQMWMKVGLANTLAARYLSRIHGSPVEQFVEAMIASTEPTPVSAIAIDLLRPVPLSSLKDEFVAPNVDARRRKSIAAMYVWLRDAGDAKLVPTLEAVQRARPADGITLVKVIKDASGIDLTASLEPR